MKDFPSIGKIQNAFFKERVFPFCGHRRSDVVVGPEYGVDVAIVNLPNGMGMAMTSDPLSLIPTLGLRESAWLSVQLMANDMATTGFKPMYGQFVLNLPTSLSAADFEIYWRYIHEFCQQLGVAITGGHTGRFDGINATVSGGGTMITIAPSEQMITSKGAQPGDVIIMTNECAMLSTSILALSFPNTIKSACGVEVQQEGCELFYRTSAVEAGVAVGKLNRHAACVTAMHDVTEGGVLGAIYELAYASKVGVSVNLDRIPVGVAQQAIGKLFNINPHFMVGAGSMIITAKEDKYALVLSQLKASNIEGTLIGKVTTAENGAKIFDPDHEFTLTNPVADPYWGAFFDAYQKGWN